MEGVMTVEVVDNISTSVRDGVERLVGGISADTIFGSPQHVGEKVVLTAAAIERMGGFGFGGGYDESTAGGGG